MLGEKHHTRTAEIRIDSNGFLVFKIKPGSVIDEEDALDNFLVIKTLTKNKKFPKLIDLRGNWKMTKKAKEVSRKNISPENTIARAYIIDSLLTRLMLNFFKSFTKPEVPQEFFKNENDAVNWLLSFNKK